jgi:hypothetical protein
MPQTHRHALHTAVPHPLRRQHAPCWPRRFGTPDRRLKAHRSHHCVCVSQTAVVLLHMSTLSDCLHQGLQEKAGAATGAGCLQAPQLQPGYSCTLPPPWWRLLHTHSLQSTPRNRESAAVPHLIQCTWLARHHFSMLASSGRGSSWPVGLVGFVNSKAATRAPRARTVATAASSAGPASLAAGSRWTGSVTTAFRTYARAAQQVDGRSGRQWSWRLRSTLLVVGWQHLHAFSCRQCAQGYLGAVAIH